MKISQKEYRYFEKARQQALLSDFERFHVGCIIVYKNRIIGRGCNSDKSDTIQKKYNKYRCFNKTENGIKHSIHAEIAALKSIPYPIQESIDWSKVKVFIYRICPGKRFHMGLARPCAACRQALVDMGVKKLFYSTDEGFAYEELY